ncbi:hypothetical protein BGW80DRAFT_1117454, partial [Lactifluus volemus]
FSTLIRSITGHAFVGAYSACFHPDQPVGCPCGAALQTIKHVVSTCPLFAQARREILLPVDCNLSLPILLGTSQG